MEIYWWFLLFLKVSRFPVSSPFGQDHSSHLASRLASAERDAKARRVAISRWLVNSLWTSDLVVGIPLNILVNMRDWYWWSYIHYLLGVFFSNLTLGEYMKWGCNTRYSPVRNVRFTDNGSVPAMCCTFTTGYPLVNKRFAIEHGHL